MATATINLDLQRIIRLIPGYEPFAQAGDCQFDQQAAADAIDFVQECCTHVKGELAGKPLLLEDWQKAIFANLWGWKRPDGTRRYREALVFIPRKNSKTTMGAAMVLLSLYTDGEKGSECYSSAAEREQARLCFEIVTGMIHNTPELLKYAKLFRYSINVGGSFYKAISAQANTKHGLNAQLVVNDELHAHKTRALTDALATAMGARRQPLLIHLTTSDYEREGSICNEKYDYAASVRDNGGDPAKPGFDPAFLPVIYEASKEDDWTDPDVWRKANPNLGVSISEEFLRRECQRAKEEPEFENEFKRLHLNVRTEQAFRWMPMVQWDACTGEVDAKALDGQPCWGGLDLATVTDMAALVLCFEVEGQYHLLPFYWCPEETAEKRERNDKQPYATWARQGLLELTPGNRIDYRFIRRRIQELGKLYKLQNIAFDPFNASHLIQQLHDEDGFDVTEFRQGALSYNEPMKHTMAAVLGQELRHGGHKILRWNFNNLAARRDPNDNLRPDKDRSCEKIDGACAALMAVGLVMQKPVRRRSVYETQRLVVG